MLVKENEILEKQNNRLSEMGKNIDNLFFFRLEDFYGFFGKNWFHFDTIFPIDKYKHFSSYNHVVSYFILFLI